MRAATTIDFDEHTMLVAAARFASKHSDDRGTQNGAIVTSLCGVPAGAGANMFLCDSWKERATDRDKKLTLIEHAERNAIFDAGRKSYSIDSGVMFCVWAACPECARAIVGSGIRRLVTLQKTRDLTPERWMAPIAEADKMLREAGVDVVFHDKPIGVSLMFNGELVEL